MTPEELDEATVEEAKRRINKNYEIGIGWLPGDVARVAARLAREGWTPAEPEPVDPDILAFREYFAERHPSLKTTTLEGDWDSSSDSHAYLAGARMAREQERERAKEVLDQANAAFDRYALVVARCLKKVPDRFRGEWDAMMKVLHGYYDTLAKYRGEA